MIHEGKQDLARPCSGVRWVVESDCKQQVLFIAIAFGMADCGGPNSSVGVVPECPGDRTNRVRRL